ncbi:MAG: hypothetical protein E7033_06710 [Akkermansiaceae bacterium]|nr:hypothetical protein [Akkermansiaceae bacterium]
MQIAQERVLILTAFEGVKSRAEACAETLHLNHAMVRKGVLAAGVASALALVLQLLRRKSCADGIVLSRGVGVGRYLSAKLATMVLIPWLRRVMVQPATEPGKPKKRGLLRRLFSRS